MSIKPGVIVSDYGTEFTSKAVLKFTQNHKLDWRYIAPGKPAENAFAESFNGRMRDEGSAPMPVAYGPGARNSQPAGRVAVG